MVGRAGDAGSVLGSSATLLRMLGLWTPQEEDACRVDRVLTGSVTLALTFGFMVTSALKLVMDRPRELEELCACIFSVTMLCEVFFKMVCFFLQGSTLRQLVQLLSDIRADDSVGERNDEIRRRYQRLVDRTFLFIMVMAIATEATWAAFPLVQQLFSSNGEVARLLPLPFWLPLDIYASPTYEVIYVVQVLLIPLSTTSLFSDFVFVDLMMRIAAELEILNYSISGLNNIKKSVSRKSKNEYKSVDRISRDKIKLQFTKNVKHHQQILRCVVLLEEVMNTGVFILFLATTIALSSNIFAATALLQTVGGTIKALKIISAMPHVLFEVGLYCVIGQMVTAQVLNGSYAMFNMLYTLQRNR
nr:odorant receptor SameORX [Schistocerca americana]